MFMTILEFIPIGLTTDEGYEKRLAVATIREGDYLARATHRIGLERHGTSRPDGG